MLTAEQIDQIRRSEDSEIVGLIRKADGVDAAAEIIAALPASRGARVIVLLSPSSDGVAILTALYATEPIKAAEIVDEIRADLPERHAAPYVAALAGRRSGD